MVDTPATDESESLSRIDELCGRFEKEWQSGGDPTLESFLGQLEPEHRQKALRELLSVELWWRRNRAESASLDDYRRRFPSDLVTLEDVWRQSAEEGCLAGQSTRTSRASGVPGSLPTVPSVAGATGVEQPRIRRIGQYEILSEINRGGMGVVYRARQIGIDRVVALKMTLAGQFAGDEERKRFLGEAIAAGQLDHPHIVPVHEVGEHEGRMFLSMGYIEGASLKDQLANGPIQPRRSAELIQTLAEAVHYAHTKGVIHRDLKPANVLIDRTGQPRITDFGLAKRIERDSGMTLEGQILGTPSFMPPEQARGENANALPATPRVEPAENETLDVGGSGDTETRESALLGQTITMSSSFRRNNSLPSDRISLTSATGVGPWSDVYSLGATLYNMLTARPPFQAADVWETLRQVRMEDPIPVRRMSPDVSRDLETICMKCLEKDPRRRYLTARELADDVGRYLRNEPILARPAGRIERSWRWCRRNPLVTGLMGSALAMVLLVIAGLWYRGQLIAAETRVESARTVQKVQEHYAFLNHAREASSNPRHGWTWDARERFQQLQAKSFEDVDPEPVRSVMADTYCRYDSRRVGTIPLDMDVSSLAFSPDGKKLAIGQRKHALNVSLLIHDAASLKQLSAFQIPTLRTSAGNIFQLKSNYQDGIKVLAWSPDGKWLAAGMRSGRIVVWDVLSSSTEPTTILSAHTDHIRQLQFSPDGKLLFSSVKELKCWSTADWAPVTIGEPSLSDFALSPDGRVICGLVRRSNVFDALDLNSWEPITGSEWSRGEGDLPVFSPTGRFLACNQEFDSSTVTLRCGRRGTTIHQWRLDERPDLSTVALMFDSSERLLIAQCSDRRVRFFKTATGRRAMPDLVSSLEAPSIAMAPTGNRLAWTTRSGERVIEIHEIQQPTAFVSLPQAGQVGGADVSPTSNRLAVATDLAWALRTPNQEHFSQLTEWDLVTGNVVKETRLSGDRAKTTSSGRAAWNPRQPAIAWTAPPLGLMLGAPMGTLSPMRFASPPDQPAPCVLTASVLAARADTQGVQLVEDKQSPGGQCLTFKDVVATRVTIDPASLPEDSFPQGATIAVEVERDRVRSPSARWSVGEQNSKVKGGERLHPALSTLPGSSQLQVIGSVPGGMDAGKQIPRIVRPNAPKSPAALDRLRQAVFTPRPVTESAALAWSPDGQRLWGLFDGNRQLAAWNADDLTNSATWDNRKDDILTGTGAIASIAAGNRWVVCGCRNGNMVVLPAASGSLSAARTVQGPGGEIGGIALNPEETWALVAAPTGEVEFRAIPEGSLLSRVAGHRDGVAAVALARDGKLFATAGEEGIVRVFQVETDEANHPIAKLWLTLSPRMGPLTLVRMCPNGRWLVAVTRGGSAVAAWDLDRLRVEFSRAEVP
jgi:serine/threonine protein kinase/WD40 repeat protein